MPVLAASNGELTPPDTIARLMRDVLPTAQRSAAVTDEQLHRVKENLSKDRDQLKAMQQHQHQQQDGRWRAELPHEPGSMSMGELQQQHDTGQYPEELGHPTLRVKSYGATRQPSLGTSGQMQNGDVLWSLHERQQGSAAQPKPRASNNGMSDPRMPQQAASSPNSARSSQASSFTSQRTTSQLRSAAPGELLQRNRSISAGRTREGPSTPVSGAVSNINAALALYEQRGMLRNPSNAELAARVNQASDALSDWQRRLRAAGANPTSSHDADASADGLRRRESPTASVNSMRNIPAPTHAPSWNQQDSLWQHAPNPSSWQERVPRRHSHAGSTHSLDSKETLLSSETRVKNDLKETSYRLADVIQHCRELQARSSADSIAALGNAAAVLQNHNPPAHATRAGANPEQRSSPTRSYSQAHLLPSHASALSSHDSILSNHSQQAPATPVRQQQSLGPLPGPASTGTPSDRSHHSDPQLEPAMGSGGLSGLPLQRQNAELMAQLRQAQGAIKELQAVQEDRNRLEASLKDARREAEKQRQAAQQVQRQLQHLQLQTDGATSETLIRSAEMRALDAEARCSTMQSENAELRMQLVALNGTSGAVKKDCERLKAQVLELHGQLAAAAARTSDAAMARRLAALEAELEVARGGQQRSIAARRELEVRITELQEHFRVASNRKVDELQSELDNRSNELSRLHAELERVTAERDSSRRQGEDVARKMKDVEAAFERIQRQLEEVHSAHAHAMEAMEGKAGELEQQLAESQRKNKRQEGVQHELEEQVKEVQGKLHRTAEQLAASQQLASSLAEGNSAMMALQERMKEQQERLSGLQLQLQSAHMAQTTMRNDLEQREALVQELTDQVRAVRVERDEAVEGLVARDASIAQLTAQLEARGKELAGARAEIDELHKAGKGVTRDMVRRAEALERMLRDHEEKLQIKSQEVLDGRDTIAVCEEQIAHFEDELAGLRSDYADLNARHAALRKDKEALAAKLGASKAQLDKLTGPGGAQGRVRELEAQVNALQVSVEALRREHKEMEARCSSMEQQVQEKEDTIIELDGRVTVLSNELERVYAAHGRA